MFWTDKLAENLRTTSWILIYNDITRISKFHALNMRGQFLLQVILQTNSNYACLQIFFNNDIVHDNQNVITTS